MGAHLLDGVSTLTRESQREKMHGNERDARKKQKKEQKGVPKFGARREKKGNRKFGLKRRWRKETKVEE
jgi:hypothetical protein